MQTVMLLALAIFLVTYILISVRRFGKLNLERPVVALFGASLMVVSGVVTADQAFASIQLDILGLLLGMMIIVVSLELCGFFTWVSVRMIRASKNQFQFLVLVMVVTALLSALILNDTVVLLFTPIVIRACRLIKANPIPFLVAEAVSANIGSVATPVGNPQNAFIVTQSHITFAEFTGKLLPVTLMCLIIAIVLIWVVFRKDLRDGCERNGRYWLCERSKPIDAEKAVMEIAPSSVHRSVYLVLGALVLVFIGFVLSPYINLPLAMVAFIGGAAVLMFLPFFNRSIQPVEVLRKVDWTLILFFVGLFVVLKGVETSGLLAEMMGTFQASSGSGLTSIPGLTGFCAILSNLISNVPAVMLLSPFVASVGSNNLWLALVTSSTLAGNATILGAAANVIVVETGNKMGVEVSFWQFMKAGLPITIITLLLSVVMLGML
ncbi:MAG TPA: anion transporter [Methanomassiliicoccales archaeon]|jgi:Na+/H+ antiporter NhaD/arsenite permease-like protein